MMSHAVGRARAGLSMQRLVELVLWAAILALAVRPPADTDTWWHLKSGQLMWDTGRILRTDPFSHTVGGRPWIDHGWLVQVLLWPVYRVLGLGGLALLLAGLVTASFWLVHRQCAGRPFVAAFAVLLAAVVSSVIWSVRPQMVSFLLAAGVAFLLDRYKRSGNPRWLWALPALVLVWVNCHGGFVVAFILMGCYLVGETLNRLTAPVVPIGAKPGCQTERAPAARLGPLLLVALACLPVVLLNPHTVKMVPYAFQTVRIGPLQEFIQEWAAPDFHRLQFHPFLWLLLWTMAAMALSRQRADWTELSLVVVFGYMGFLAVRNTALFALVAPPVLTRHAVAALDDLATTTPRLSWLTVLGRPRSERPSRRQVVANGVLLGLVIAAAGIKVGLELVRLRDPAVWGRGLPLGAVEYLRSHDLPGAMFNSYNWGGYLIWSLYPDMPVFIDGRTDLYALNGSVLDDYTRVHWLRPGWQQVLDRYRVGFVLTERTGLLDMALAEAEGWEAVYRDDLAVIYGRTHEAR